MTDQHLDSVGLLKAKVEGEIARLEPSIADRENYDDTRVRLHVKAEALRWVLREIEALPPVGVGEEKGMGSCDSASPTRYQSDEAPLPSIAAPASEELAERVARAIYEAKTKLPVTRPGFTHWATWDECCQMEGWLEGQKDTARAALAVMNGGLSSATDNGSATILPHSPKPLSPTTTVSAEDLERAAREHWDTRSPIYARQWHQLTAAEKSYECDLMRAALLALGLPVEPGQ